MKDYIVSVMSPINRLIIMSERQDSRFRDLTVGKRKINHFSFTKPVSCGLGDMLIGLGFFPVVEVVMLIFWIFNVVAFYFRCYL